MKLVPTPATETEPANNRKAQRAKKDQSKTRAKKSSEKSTESAEKRRALKRTTRHLAAKSAEKLTEFKKSQLVILNEIEIDEIASIKEKSRAEIHKNKVSLSEKYLIDCAKEKVTGQQSNISHAELSEKRWEDTFANNSTRYESPTNARTGTTRFDWLQ